MYLSVKSIEPAQLPDVLNHSCSMLAAIAKEMARGEFPPQNYAAAL
jgi:hypothetical protein